MTKEIEQMRLFVHPDVYGSIVYYYGGRVVKFLPAGVAGDTIIPYQTLTNLIESWDTQNPSTRNAILLGLAECRVWKESIVKSPKLAELIENRDVFAGAALLLWIEQCKILGIDKLDGTQYSVWLVSVFKSRETLIEYFIATLAAARWWHQEDCQVLVTVLTELAAELDALEYPVFVQTILKVGVKAGSSFWCKIVNLVKRGVTENHNTVKMAAGYGYSYLRVLKIAVTNEGYTRNYDVTQGNRKALVRELAELNRAWTAAEFEWYKAQYTQAPIRCGINRRRCSRKIEQTVSPQFSLNEVLDSTLPQFREGLREKLKEAVASDSLTKSMNKVRSKMVAEAAIQLGITDSMDEVFRSVTSQIDVEHLSYEDLKFALVLATQESPNYEAITARVEIDYPWLLVDSDWKEVYC